MNPAIRLSLAFILYSSASPLGGRYETAPNKEERLSLAEARLYMVDVINRDRAVRGLKPVVLDTIATDAGQRHAEEMARARYLAHWNREGKLPDQRYTEAGGAGCVAENIYLYDQSVKGADAANELNLEPNPTFTRQEIEEIEAAYFNQYPGHDGHRRNVLNPHHTRVGIGLARTGGESARCLANAQEFVTDGVEVDRIPDHARPGDTIVISGRIRAGSIHSVEIGRLPLPAEMNRLQLLATRAYSSPSAFRTLFADDPDSHFKVTPDGRFECPIVLSDEKKPGVYYVRVLTTRDEGRAFAASQRTIIVK